MLLPFLAASCALLPQSEPRTAPVVLRGVHVVDVELGAIVRDRALLLENGRIARITGARELASPPGAVEVEGRGRYLVPGLCDMHVHLDEGDGDEYLQLYLARGVTTVQCMGGGEHQKALRERVRGGDTLGPRIFTCGPTTAALQVRTVEQAERMVREQKAAGYDAIKMYGDGSDTMSRATYHALVATAKKVGIKVVGHAPRNLPFAAVLEEGQDSIDHMEEVVYTEESLGRLLKPFVDLQFGRASHEGNPLRAAPVPDFARELEAEVRQLARRVKAAKTQVTPTLCTFGTIQATIDTAYADLLARPELRYVPPARRLEWTPEKARFRNSGWKPHLAFMAEYLRRNLELQLALTRAFHAEGVPLMTGTDSPFDFVVQGFALHDELALFVRAGLTPLDALRSATLVPARFLGLAADAGSIAEGKRADLVLLEADPLADIGATRAIAGVFLAGRWFPRAELDARIEVIAREHERESPLVTGITAALDAGRVEAAVELYRAEKNPAPAIARGLERGINSLGYRLLNGGELSEAVRVFEQNCALFPESANAWDSLGEARWKRREKDGAIEAYERSLALGNENARAILETIVASD